MECEACGCDFKDREYEPVPSRRRVCFQNRSSHLPNRFLLSVERAIFIFNQASIQLTTIQIVMRAKIATIIRAEIVCIESGLLVKFNWLFTEWQGYPR
jgi:hypothetical protein